MAVFCRIPAFPGLLPYGEEPEPGIRLAPEEVDAEGKS
jgi:hypothetical protein